MRNGGPAFPIANATFNADAPDSFEQFKAATSQSQGMNLRDYFAAAALTGILASGTEWIGLARSEGGSGVKLAYGYADDMLAEREKS